MPYRKDELTVEQLLRVIRRANQVTGRVLEVHGLHDGGPTEPASEAERREALEELKRINYMLFDYR